MDKTKNADTLNIKTASHIQTLTPYEPGKPIEDVERELGIQNSIKLASNENPLGPSPKAMEAVRACLSNLHRYPDGAAHGLTNAVAEHIGVSPDQIVLGAGSDDIIHLLTRVLLRSGDEAVMPAPSFLMYDLMVRAAGGVSRKIPLDGLMMDLPGMYAAVGSKTKIVFICNPNNPTGAVVSRKAFEIFLKSIPDQVVVVVDEAYMEFVRDPDCAQSLEYQQGNRPLVTLKTFSKAYGLAGLRVGYGVMPSTLADLLHRIRQPFNVSIPAQEAASAALGDTDFIDETLRTVHLGLDYLYAELEKRGIRFFPTQANFFLIDTGRDANAVFDAFLKRGVIVRSMVSYGFPAYIRVTVGRPPENQRFLAVLDDIL